MTTPSVSLPGAFGIPAVAPVYIDGIPAGEVSVPSAKKSSSQDFWSSQLRLPGDGTAEQLTVSLAQQRLVNYITVDLPHFPHAVSFYWWDGAAWQPVRGSSGAPLVIVTSGSVPAVVDNPAALNAGMNPYHYGAGHWVHHDEQIVPVLTSRLMLSCQRTGLTSGRQQFPVNPQGKIVPYPLGVRNLDFGSRILTAADVPPTTRSPVTLTMREPFTTTVDVNGSPVQVAVRENRASDLLNGATWRCAPQPSARAVVPLYLDSRDKQGQPQVIDSFYIEPVTSGIRFSLYYSADPPPAGTGFAAVDDPILPSLLTAAGTQLPVTAKAGIVFPDFPGWLTVANQAAGTSSAEPWWAALEIMPGFAYTDPGTYIIADAGLIQLSFQAGAWIATMPTPSAPGSPNQPSGAVLGDWVVSHAPGDKLQFVIGYDGSSFFAWSAQDSQLFHTPVSGAVPPAPVFQFGGLQDINPADAVLAGNYTLTAFILKQEQVDLTSGGTGGIPPQLTEFAADPSGYVYPPTVAGEVTTQNAVARFHPSWILGKVCPWGFVGGLGAAYEQCSWVPVPRSYALHRGYVQFDPVLASAWKFEFTNLQPEPYDYLRPVVVKARYYASSDVPSAADQDPSTPAVLDPGMTVNQNVAPGITFTDAPARKAAPDPSQVLPTEALYATDPGSGASQLAAAGGSLFNFQPWQPPHRVPQPVTPGPTAYVEQETLMLSRVAYFVAISSIEMYRTDYTAADDAAQYTETFADAANIDQATLETGGWTWIAGTGLVSPSNTVVPAQAQSLTYNSAHAVTGVQFATVQSEPVQLLSDPDFSSPDGEFDDWGPVGDALPLAPAPVNAQLGNMVLIQRGQGSPQLDTPNAPLSWAWLESVYTTWAAIQQNIPSWLDFATPPASSAVGGLAYTGAPVVTTGAGRLHAAARVFSPVALTAPLFLQLVDGATGLVIAEEEQAVAGGAVTEWFTGYTLGEGTVSSNTWLQVETAYPLWSNTSGLTWSQVDTSTAPLGTTVTARLIQKVSTSDSWGVDNLSVFEDAIVWEFSNDGGATWYPAYDVRNNPRGALMFPAANPGQGTQLKYRLSAYAAGLVVSALAIRPWYTTWPRGIMPRPAGIGHGPNLAPQDHYAAIEDDPRWQLNSTPIPDSWYFSTRQALGITPPGSDFPGPAQPVPDADLGNALVFLPSEAAPLPPQTFSDIYTDVYTDTYGPADAGDVYTDTYSDVYGSDYLATTGTVRSAAASLSAPGTISAAGSVTAFPLFGAGVDLGPVAASDPSVAAWIAATGAQVPARRITLGNQIPASLAASPAAGDAGLRRVLFDIQPDSTTTPAQLGTFLASCAAGGLAASVSIWAGADTAFANPQDFLDLIPSYAAVVHANGYRVVLAVGNTAVNSGWLNAWYPGDEYIDVIAPAFWCTGDLSETIATAQYFADQHGKALGLSGYGVDHAQFTAAQGESYIAYVQQVFTARKAADKPCYDLFWLGTGTYSVVTAPAGLLAAYRALAAAI